VYRFIASDLDGTLLDEHHCVNALTAQTLQQLEARGLRFAWPRAVTIWMSKAFAMRWVLPPI
jgi:phosphoglycolate phosphatase-like HAD superfamily hydrolase